MIELTFSHILHNEPQITDLVGSDIFPLGSAVSSDLYMVYQLLNRSRPADINNVPAQQRAMFQLDIYSNQLSRVVHLTNSIVSNLHSNTDYSISHNIQLIRVDSERTGFVTEEKLFNKSLDIVIFFDE